MNDNVNPRSNPLYTNHKDNQKELIRWVVIIYWPTMQSMLENRHTVSALMAASFHNNVCSVWLQLFAYHYRVARLFAKLLVMAISQSCLDSCYEYNDRFTFNNQFILFLNPSSIDPSRD